MDVIEAYRRSLTGFVERVAQIRADQWEQPTPCPDWTVRGLVNHLVGEERWSVPLFAGATIAEVGDRYDGDLLGADPVAAVTEAAKAAEAAVAEPVVLDRTVHLSFGDTPAEEYLRQLLADHLVHSWDLAAAIGTDPGLDADLVAECASWYADREELYRQAGAVGPRVEPAPQATRQDRLIGAFGRDPAWHPTG